MIKVLLVDDDPECIDAIARFFNMRGFEAKCVLSGFEALDAIKKDKPDCVLLDINMPKMNGIQTLQKIKEIDKNIKVIMVTAFIDEDKEIICKELGAEGYLIKPITFKGLDEKVKNTVGKE